MLSIPKIIKMFEKTGQYAFREDGGEHYLLPCNKLANDRVYNVDKTLSFYFPNGMIVQYNRVDQICVEENDDHTAIILYVCVMECDPFESTLQKLVIPKYTLDYMAIHVIVEDDVVGAEEYTAERGGKND